MLSIRPTPRARDELARIKRNLATRKLADPQAALALLVAASMQKESRPLLKGVRDALGRWAAADANARLNPLATLLLEDASVRERTSEHLLRVGGPRSSNSLVHLWADGQFYGHPSLAPSIRLLCRSAIIYPSTSIFHPEQVSLLERGSWTAPSSSALTPERCWRCPACETILRQHRKDALPLPAVKANENVSMKRLDGEARERYLSQSALPYHAASRHRRHLARVCSDRLVNPPADLEELRERAAIDYWAQLLHTASTESRDYPAGVLDRASVTVSKSLRSRLISGSPILTHKDWREMLGHLLPDGDVWTLGQTQTWEGWSDDASRRSRRQKYQEALKTRVRTRQRA